MTPVKLDADDASVIIDVFYKRVYHNLFPFYADSVIVDIGAHRGYFSIFCDSYSGKNSTIHALEPEPSNFSRLRDNIKANQCSKVQPHNMAVSGETGTRELYVSKSVNHTLVKTKGRHPKDSQEKSVSVNAVTLADFFQNNQIERVDFLKLDCEGSEYEILLQCPKSVLDRIRVIALEFHDTGLPGYNVTGLIHFLEINGYQLVKLEFQETMQPLQMGILVMKNNGYPKSQ
ncbi:FkbM family methyltransferase [Balneolales bacterium ANBcel1]|nr:FkbM family methyltransferase [Balneolales bacterium ANBcel1]